MVMSSFRHSVHLALQDTYLRRNMDALTGRMHELQHRAWAAMADPEAARVMARAVRENALARLSQLLVALETRASKNGIVVHWAETAEDACQVIQELVHHYDARHVIKSGSTTTEEIRLNAALEDIGVQVLETALGEYVLQLADEPPSHMVAPAAHLTADDVASIFREKLGVRTVLNPQNLVDAARRRLRRAFTEADIGISGVNFAVAETGTLVLVTNEGNGCMVTTLPRVHVALMGLDKVVATWEELGVLLQVLSRSATGQPLTSYVSLIHGPRRAGDMDGPEAVHLIILDNGRSEVLARGFGEALTCIRCAACLNACPVYREIGGQAYGSPYPGPIGAVLSPLLWPGDHADLPFASTLCGACRDVCPVGIDLPDLLLRLRVAVRGQSGREDRTSVLVRVWAWAVAKPGRMRALARWVGHLGRLFWPSGWTSGLPGPLKGWTRARDFPLPATKSFQALWQERARRERT